MKPTKRILALVLCALLFFATGCQNEPQEAEPPEEILGEIVTVDGLQQNVLRYITDAYYENGEVHYTVVNETTERVRAVEKAHPYIEKWINGEWVAFPLYQHGGYAPPSFEGKTRTELSFTVDYNQDQLPGKYRLSMGFYPRLNTREDEYLTLSVYPEDAVAIVGYMTISEADSPPVDPDIRSYGYTRYHNKVTLCFEEYPEEHPLYRYQYRFTNSSDKPLVISFISRSYMLPTPFPEHEKYNEETGYYERAFVGGLRYKEEHVAIPPGESYVQLFEFNISSLPEDLYAPEDGEYRFTFPCHFEGEEATAFTVFVHFTVENGVVTEQETKIP
jgi:hypothetical protein